MTKQLKKVIKACAKAGITPNELRYAIFADMDQMLYDLDKKGLTLFDLLAVVKRDLDTDELVERVNQLTRTQDEK